MTPVQISEKIRDHLINQNAQSRGGTGNCRYRGENSNMCAIGCLIADEFYDASLENKGSNHPLVLYALNQSGLDFKPGSMTAQMLKEWQCYHDGVYLRWVSASEEKKLDHTSPAYMHQRFVTQLGIA